MESRTKTLKTKIRLKPDAPTNATSNRFFTSAYVCGTVSSHTTTQASGSLALDSKGSKYCLEKSSNLDQHAHVILQAVMNDHEEVRHLLQQAAELYGRENVWKLLIQPVSGTEEHSGRYWDNVSAIAFAALSGNLYQYLYKLVDLEKDEYYKYVQLEKGKLYVSIESLGESNTNLLSYRLINTQGKMVKNTIRQELLGCTLSDPLDLRELNACLPAIMAITYQRGETNDVNPQDPETARTFLLNLLFEYIPQEFRKSANEQLLDLQASGSVMNAYLDLVSEYDAYIKNFNDEYKKHKMVWDEMDWDKLNTAWQKGVGGKQKQLPWFGLRFMCAKINWDQMLDINHLSAPVGEPMILVKRSKASLKSHLSELGSSWAMYHDSWRDCKRWRNGVPGGAVYDNRVVIRDFVKVKNMQLAAFIAWQQLLDEKYREENKYNLILKRR